MGRRPFACAPDRASADGRGVGPFGFGWSVAPMLPVGRQGSPGLLGCPSPPCRGLRPRRGKTVLARWRRRLPWPSGEETPSAHRESILFEAHSHGPVARLPTHQPWRCRRGCKAGCRPAGLRSGRTGLSPAGQLFRISRSYRNLAPSGPAGPGRYPLRILAIRRREPGAPSGAPGLRRRDPAAKPTGRMR